MDNYNYDTDQYFATLEESQGYLGSLMSKIDNWYTYIQSVGTYQIWVNSYQTYYSSFKTAGSLGQSGEQGEYSILKINHYRSLLQRIISMTAKDRIAFDAVATNSDYKSLAQAKIANQVLDYYTKQNKLNRLFKKALETCLWAGESFFNVEWNTTGGEKIGVVTDELGNQTSQYEGDFVFNVFSPLDIIRDITLTNGTSDEWFITRQMKNKWNLAAKYKDKAAEIVDASFDTKNLIRYTAMGLNSLIDYHEQVPYYVFYHKRTEALPNGRLTIFINDELVLYDGPLPYKEMPLYRMAADDFEGSMFGYSVAYDMLPIQEAINNMNSIIVTHQNTFGVQNVLIPKGTNIIPNALSKGLNAIEYDKDAGEVKALNLLQTSQETYAYAKTLVTDMETISGVNTVARGNIPYSNMSGSALALIQSMAIEFNNNLEGAYVSVIEQVGTAMVNILKEYAKTPRVAAIAGKTSAPELLQFKGKDIENVNRVTVDVGNALANTIAGRMDIADKLLEKKIITNSADYINVIVTGDINQMLDPDSDEALLIKDENEMLARGENTPVVATDRHIQHIKGHASVANSVEARRNPALLKATTDHINEHIRSLKEVDPDLLQILEEPVLGGRAAQGGQPAAMGPAGGQPKMPALPGQSEMPVNPLSGEQWNPTNGGLPAPAQ